MRETSDHWSWRGRSVRGGVVLGALAVLLGLTGCASVAGAIPGGNGAAVGTRTTPTTGTARTGTADSTDSGARSSGGTGSGVDLLSVRTIVALGDSVTAGYGCDCDPFPDRIATALSDRSGHSVDAVNDAVSGQTAHELADVLSPSDGDEDVRADVAGADIVLVTIGANDIADLEPDPEALSVASSAATRQAVATAGADLTRVLAEIKTLAPEAHVLVTGYWNVFPDGTAAAPDAAERAWTDAVTRAFNAELDRVAAAGGVQVVDLYDPFKAGGQVDPAPLLLEDGDHPNARGHQVIADAVLRAIGF